MNGQTGRESSFRFDCCLLWETNAVFCDCSDRTLLGAGVLSQHAWAQLWLGLREGEVEVVAADGRAVSARCMAL